MKKGQVTIFIIIGLVIIGTVGGVLIVKSIIDKRGLESQEREVTLLPQKVRPIKASIDSCIEQISKDAIKIIGLQGGYITLPEDEYQTSAFNSFSNHLTIFSDLRVPYWYYQNIAGTEKQEIPQLELMETQIAGYINEQIPRCIPEAQQISRQGYTLTTEQPQTKINIKKNQNLNIEISYPLIFEIEEETFNFKNFDQNLDLDLYNIYQAAIRIAQNEISTNFLEEQTTDMMVIYDEIPYDFVEFTCTKKLWSTENVKESFKDILATNIPIIKIKDTDYSLKEPSRTIFEWDALKENFNHLNINLAYSKNWPFQIEITPNDNGILKGKDLGRRLESQQLGLPLGLICLNEYHFIYDVKYPILLTINDPNALNGEGFLFQYALQVVIDNNQPRKNKFVPILRQDDNDFCSRPGQETRIVSLTRDSNGNLQNLPDSEISYKCSTTSCNLGKTSYDSTGEASLTTRIPPCVNGLLSAKKAGYSSGGITLSSTEPGVASLVLEKLYEQEIEIKVIDSQGTREPRETEQIIIHFRSDDYSTSYIHPSRIPLKLIPGDYTIETQIVLDSETGITIPGSNQEKCTDIPKSGIQGLFGIQEEKCITVNIPDTVLDQVVVGGAISQIQISSFDLSGNNILTIPTKYNRIPTSLDDLTRIQAEIEQNAQEVGFPSPRFEWKKNL